MRGIREGQYPYPHCYPVCQNHSHCSSLCVNSALGRTNAIQYCTVRNSFATDIFVDAVLEKELDYCKLEHYMTILLYVQNVNCMNELASFRVKLSKSNKKLGVC